MGKKEAKCRETHVLNGRLLNLGKNFHYRLRGSVCRESAIKIEMCHHERGIMHIICGSKGRIQKDGNMTVQTHDLISVSFLGYF